MTCPVCGYLGGHEIQCPCCGAEVAKHKPANFGVSAKAYLAAAKAVAKENALDNLHPPVLDVESPEDRDDRLKKQFFNSEIEEA